MSDDASTDVRSRDSVSLLLIGGFFIVFGLLVLIGIFWEDWGAGMVVNVAASFVLFSVGLGMTWAGRRLRPQPGQSEDGTGT